MDIKLGRLLLETTQPARLYHFLSFIFDVEAEVDDKNQIEFEADHLRFSLCQVNSVSASPMGFSLEVGGIEELESLFQSVEFYYYKEGVEKFEISKKTAPYYFTDPDQRKWTVEIQQPNLVNHSSIPNEKHVRMC